MDVRYMDRVASHAIDDYVWQSADDQLARARNASLSSSQRVFVERIRGIEYRFRNRTRGGRIVFSDYNERFPEGLWPQTGSIELALTLSAFQFAFHSRPDIGCWNKVATIRLGQPGSDSLLESSLLWRSVVST